MRNNRYYAYKRCAHQPLNQKKSVVIACVDMILKKGKVGRGKE